MRRVGTHKRNTEALVEKAKEKREEAFHKFDAAIRKLLREREPINFANVARESGCSQAWLYKEPDVAERIRKLRTQQSSKKSAIPKAEQASTASLRAQNEALRQRNKKITEENERLKRQIAVAYGLLREHGIKFPEQL